MKPATDAQKLFIYRVGKLADDKNRAVIEGVTKAFGLIDDIDTTHQIVTLFCLSGLQRCFIFPV